MRLTLYRVECSCSLFSAATRNSIEAAKLKLLHSSWNADVIDNAGEAAAFLGVEFTPEFLMGVFLGIVAALVPFTHADQWLVPA